jgi:hypothetical protein
MKKALLPLLLAPSAFAQWVVHDPVNTAVNTAIQSGQLANHAEVLTRWAENLAKLNQQLEQLQAQLAEQRHLRQILGDPAAAGDRLVTDHLGSADLGRNYGETTAALRALAGAVDSLKNTAQGIFTALDDRTVLNQPFTRQSAVYRRYAAVEQHAGNLDTVFAQTDARRATLLRDLADTLQQLKAAPTQADVDKLHAQIGVLNGQLAALAAQRRDAAEQLQAQQILNENQAAKERQDLLEKQIAEEQQTLSAVNAWQQGVKLTPTSYSPP